MQDPNQPDSPLDEPLCVCGYPKTGLPTLESPCPECGSTVLAVYKPSYSYTGWCLGAAGAHIAFIHLPLGFVVLTLLDAEDDLLHVPWLFMTMPLGVLSLLFTVLSIRKREPKRRSLGNVSLALFAILFYPVALACVYALAQGA